MIQPDKIKTKGRVLHTNKRDVNTPLSTSVFDDDNTNVNQSRPPLNVSKRTNLYEQQGEFSAPIYTNEVGKMNQDAEINARRTARRAGGKYIKNEDGTETWQSGPYHSGEPVNYTYTEIVKGDDGRYSRVQRTVEMQKPDSQPKVESPKKNAPIVRDEKGKAVTTVGKDGIKRVVKSKENTNNKTSSSSTSKKTQRGTGKTYEDVWKNATPEYKKRFGGDKKKAIQAMKDWNAEQDAKNAKKNTPTKKKNASASTVSEAKKKKQTSRSMFDKIPQGRKI